MKKIGGYMAIAGILLIVLPYFGLTIMFLGKIDELGTMPAWAIKIGLIVVGAVLFFMGKSQPDTDSDNEVTLRDGSAPE